MMLKDWSYLFFSEPEPQILSYPTQQHKLFPLLATAYAFHFVQLAMMKIYTDVNDQINNSNFSRIQEVFFLFLS